MIFAVLDPSPLTVCINCSFFTFISYNSYAHNKQRVNPGHVKGFDGVEGADALISSLKLSAALT